MSRPTKIAFKIGFVVACIFAQHVLFANGTPILQSNYTVLSVSSDNETHPVAHAFDGDSSTWWAIYHEDGFSLPAYIEIELDKVYDINGFSYLPNLDNNSNKALEFEIFLSEDGSEWGNPERRQELPWNGGGDNEGKDVFFGAVKAKYILLAYNTSQNTGNGNIHTAELVFFESDTKATGQENQIITFEQIGKKYGSDLPFDLSAESNSGLTLSYEVISGPASITGSELTLNGEGGIVEIRAIQEGNADYYPAEVFQQFEVVDLNTFHPSIETRLSEAHPIEMNDLVAYPIYVSANIGEPEVLSISTVSININGESFEAKTEGDHFYLMWTPSDFGNHQIEIKATASNGNSAQIDRNVVVTDEAEGQTVSTMEDVVIQFGGQNSRWYYGDYALPQSVGVYNKIMAFMNIECPNNDCDDWDRLAYIDIKGPDGNWIQLIRYITPYGVGCFHQIDLTDYQSLLQGDVELRMFIDTWGTGGWQISLELEHTLGIPEYLYSSVDEIWDGTWDLGNPSNLHSVPSSLYEFNTNTEASHLRLSTTGHGWGANNSQNAAEFYHATNFVEVNGAPLYTQDLWNICNPNPDNCYGQQGTWQYNRAGWCPGAISPPDIIDLQQLISMGELSFDYLFDPSYVDHCHPNNIDCISGITCENCNAGYNPHYVIDAQIINYSNQPLIHNIVSAKFVDQTLDYDIKVLPNPSSGKFKVSTNSELEKIHMTIYDQAGIVQQKFTFDNASFLEARTFDLTEAGPGLYFIKIENAKGMGVEKLIIQN